MTAAELRKLLGAMWPERDPAALAYAVRGLLPVAHIPPRGVWGKSGPVAMTTVEAWLGRGVEPDHGPDEMILRYLRAFGPATTSDIRTWSDRHTSDRRATPATAFHLPRRTWPGPFRRARSSVAAS